MAPKAIPGENIVWYDALAPRPDVLRLFSSLPAGKVTGDYLWADTYF